MIFSGNNNNNNLNKNINSYSINQLVNKTEFASSNFLIGLEKSIIMKHENESALIGELTFRRASKSNESHIQEIKFNDAMVNDAAFNFNFKKENSNIFFLNKSSLSIFIFIIYDYLYK